MVDHTQRAGTSSCERLRRRIDGASAGSVLGPAEDDRRLDVVDVMDDLT